MKKILALVMAVAMVLSIVTIPVMAEKNDPTSSISQGQSSNQVQPADAANLDEALNVTGGNLTFTTEGEYPWVVEGDYAKSSNVNISSSTSSVTTVVTAAEGDIVQFDFESFGEGSSTVWDGLEFYVDNTKVTAWSRVEEWTTYTYGLTAGEHTLTWTYKKDSSVDKPGDYAALDNVYVGEPVHPASVEVQPVSVPAGRRVRVEYTVLPANTFDKSVTFATADESIATVTAEGYVVGVAEGTTTITVTTVDGNVTGTAPVTVTEAVPTVYLEGYMAYDPDATSAIWGRFADYDPSVVENLGAMPTTFGAAFAGGNVYGYLYDSDSGDTRFYVMDEATHTVTYPGTSAGRTVVAMAYDYTAGTMYAIAANDAEGRSIYTVDLALGTLTEVAALDAGADTIMTLAIDGEGNAYGVSYADPGPSNFYSIDLATGACTFVGTTGLGVKYVQAMTWDHNTDQLFWAQYYDATNNGLYIVDPATGACTECGPIGTGAEVTCLYTVNDLPIAPIEMPDFTVTFVDGLTNDVLSTITVEGGTVVPESAFPAAPEHEGYEFVGWDYNNSPVYSNITIKAKYRDPNATTATITLWTEDVWGDGSGYQMLLDSTHSTYGTIIPATGPLTQSGDAPAGLYDNFDYKIPVNADGSLTTNNVVCGTQVSIEVPAGTYDWCIANPTAGDRIWIASNQGNIGGRADDYEFEAGKTYTFHVYLSGQNDATDVEISEGGTTPGTPEPGEPTPVVPETPAPGGEATWDFEQDPVAQGFTMIDQDGDGNNWQWNYGGEAPEPHGGVGVMYSNSYINYQGPLTPDNWLVTPAFTAGSAITFYMKGQDPSYPAEPIGVYVSTDNGATWSSELGYFVGTGDYVQNTVDISAYAGQTVKVAFRHYNVTDMFIVNLDDIAVVGGGTPDVTPVPETPAPGSVVFAVEDVTVNAGETVVVPVTISGDYEAHILNLQVNYDEDAFTAEVARGAILEAAASLGGTVICSNQIAGSIRIGVMMPEAAFSGSGALANVTLTAAANATGAHPIEIVVTEFRYFPVGGEVVDLPNAVQNGVVTVGGGTTPETPAPGGVATITLWAEDVWGDGSGYQMLLDSTHSTYGTIIPEQGPLTQSGNAPAGLYDNFDYTIPVNADGNLNTSNIVCGDRVTITIPAGTYDWCMANPTPGDRIWIASAQGNVGGRADDYVFEAGKTYEFHIYLMGQNDATDVNVTGGGEEPTPVVPETPAPGGNVWDFEQDPVAQGFTMIDQDGDGYNWEWNYGGEAPEPHGGVGVMYSNSYVNYMGPLTPDNWLVTPAFTAGSAITFYMKGQDPSYPAEPIGVYVSTDNGATWSSELGYFVGTGDYVQNTVDISAYAGQTVKVAFRHYNVTDMFIVNLDDIAVVGGGTPDVTPTPIVTPDPTPVPGDEAQLYGYIAYDPSGSYGFWGSFTSGNPANVTSLGAMTTTFAAEFAGGVVYGYTQEDGQFYTVDTNTWQYTIAGASIAPALVIDMAYNHANQTMYAIVAPDPNGSDDRNLCTVDLATGALTVIDTIDAIAMNLSISTDGNAYVIAWGDDDTALLCSLNLNDASTTLIGDTGVAINYVQGATWDHNTNRMYWAQYCDTDNNGLCLVDVNTANVTNLGKIGGGAEVVGMFTMNNLPVDPITPPEDVTVTFVDGVDGSTIGSYDVTPGTVLDPADFPAAPEHDGLVFTGWDYNGAAVWADLTVTAKYRDPNMAAWFFEEDPYAEGWTRNDADGDGFNWEWAFDVGLNVFEGSGCMNSASYINNLGSLTPDNWLISPAFTAGTEVTFYMAGQDPDWAAEVVSTYVSNDGGANWFEDDTITATGEYTQYSIDTSDFVGQTIMVAFRHHDVTDMFSVNIDQVESVNGGSTPTPTPEVTPVPEDPTPTPEVTPVPVDPDAVQVTMGSVYAMPGQDVQLVLNFANDKDYTAHALNLWVDYDASVLSVVDVTANEVLNEITQQLGGTAMLDYTSIEGSIRLGVMMPTNGFHPNGNVYTVTFHVSEEAVEGTIIPVEINVKELTYMPVGGESVELPTQVTNGQITVGEEPIVTPEPEDPTPEPGEPTPEPGEPTPEPGEPTPEPTTPPTPPTGTITLVGAGLVAVLAGAGVVLFRKKED